MGKGGGPQFVQQEVTQTNLPKYAEPYVVTGLQAAQGELNRALTQGMPKYTQAVIDPATGQQKIDPTTGQGMVEAAPRVALLTPEQKDVNARIQEQRTPQGLIAGQQLAGTAGLGSLMASGYAPSSFSSQTAGAGTAQAGSAEARGQEGL